MSYDIEFFGGVIEGIVERAWVTKGDTTSQTMAHMVSHIGLGEDRECLQVSVAFAVLSSPIRSALPTAKNLTPLHSQNLE